MPLVKPLLDELTLLPIGSGEIESSHKYIPQKRLKIPGSTWHPDSLNPM